jgi:2-polyprenyl-3-methyl-5-hydroxy-6-metoxy-1,4-benzoquinol methylase
MEWMAVEDGSRRGTVLGYVDAFADDFADGYADASWKGRFYRRRLELVMAELRGAQGATVLDVGCGAGLYFEPCADLGLDYRGVDLSERMIDGARRRVATADADRFSIGMLPELDVPDSSIDFVLCLGVLEYLGSDERSIAMGDIARTLAPGGAVIVSALNRAAPFWIARDARAKVRTAVGRRLRVAVPATPPELYFSKRDIIDIVGGADLGVERYARFGMELVPDLGAFTRTAGFAAMTTRLESLSSTPAGVVSLAHLVVARKQLAAD